MVNQSIPLIYRHMVQNAMNDLYGETEYEFNEVCLLKKIAAFFVTLATNKEPEKEEELLEVLQKWHDDQLIYAPREDELKLLMDQAYRIVQSFKDRSNLLPLSAVTNAIEAYVKAHTVIKSSPQPSDK